VIHRLRKSDNNIIGRSDFVDFPLIYLDLSYTDDEDAWLLVSALLYIRELGGLQPTGALDIVLTDADDDTPRRFDFFALYSTICQPMSAVHRASSSMTPSSSGVLPRLSHPVIETLLKIALCRAPSFAGRLSFRILRHELGPSCLPLIVPSNTNRLDFRFQIDTILRLVSLCLIYPYVKKSTAALFASSLGRPSSFTAQHYDNLIVEHGVADPLPWKSVILGMCEACWEVHRHYADWARLYVQPTFPTDEEINDLYSIRQDDVLGDTLPAETILTYHQRPRPAM